MKIFIPGNVPSLKNSKIKTSHGIFMSKTCKQYLREFGINNYSVRQQEVKTYSKKENLFEKYAKRIREEAVLHEMPMLIGFYFVRDSRRSFDFNNMTQIICDLLTANRAVIDDSVDVFSPYPCDMDGNLSAKCWHVDKHRPGVWIFI